MNFGSMWPVWILVAITSVGFPSAAFAAGGKHVVTPLKFAEIFKRPVGPNGLELTDTVRALEGRQVRVVGYVVAQGDDAATLLLAPLPVALGDEDEGMADDLPPSTIALHSSTRKPLPRVQGLVEVVGELELVPREDPSTGRVISAHVSAHPRAVRALRDFPAATPSKSPR
jgi:hypothetical protein